ncbi:MAG: iron-sulfur cluster assembly accessory protein [Immundisolibacteraceae bacterium]|nr:iron-sulfur cluster assembly accessory protein [Immundisolibacteraceae bacterium]
MITLTPSAIERVRAVLNPKNGEMAIRIGVKESGCSGFSYIVEQAKAIDGEDLQFDQGGVQVVVSPEHLPMLEGIELDYRKDGLNSAFAFKNPQAKETCGCGESFTV